MIDVHLFFDDRKGRGAKSVGIWAMPAMPRVGEFVLVKLTPTASRRTSCFVDYVEYQLAANEPARPVVVLSKAGS